MEIPARNVERKKSEKGTFLDISTTAAASFGPEANGKVIFTTQD